MATQYPNNQSSQNVADKGMGSQTQNPQQKDISSNQSTGRTSSSTGTADNLGSNQSSSTSSQNKF